MTFYSIPTLLINYGVGLGQDDSILVPTDFIFGGDISSFPQVNDAGTVFLIDGIQTDLFEILTPIGFNMARLRLWVDPSSIENAVNGYCNLSYTLTMAQRIKAAGWNYFLDFHYSDWWADPDQQTKPHDWEGLSLEQLKDQVYNYTYIVLDALFVVNATPSMVQIGNEISHGFLWPEGGTTNFTQFSHLLAEGISAVKDFNLIHSDLPSISVIIHFAPGEHASGANWFFSQIEANNLQYDLIGLSYYPKWHGTITELSQCLDSLLQFNKDIIIIETSYGWTTNWNDDHSNVFWTDSLHSGYPANPEGQRQFFSSIINLILQLPNQRGKGVFLWEPAWITPCVGGSPMENQALFDFTNNMLDVYRIPLIKKIGTTTSIATSSSNSTSPKILKIPGFPFIPWLISCITSGIIKIYSIRKKDKN